MKHAGLISRLKHRRLEICFLLILVFTVLLKLPSLQGSHWEFDERLYGTLAKHFYATGHYTLQGTLLLEEMAPEMYDRPLFYQPPLFVFLSIPLVLNFGDNSAVILAWAGHLLVLLSIFLFLRDILKDKPLLILMVVCLAAMDPIMVFASQKIWIDSLEAGFAGVSMYAFWKGCLAAKDRSKIKYFLLSGVLLGAAILTKVPAVLLGPFYAVIYLRYHYRLPIRKNIVLLSATLLPALILIFPWFALTYHYFGKLIDTPILPETLLQTNKYLRILIGRPPYHYLKEIVLLSPIILLPFIYGVTHLKKISALALAFWASLFSAIGGYTYFAVMYHQAYVMRYLTLISIPFYVLVGLYFGNRMRPVQPAADGAGGQPVSLFDNTLLLLALVFSSMTVMFIVMYHLDILLNLYSLLNLTETLKSFQ